MRLVCWNLQHRVAAWDRLKELVDECGVDVALLWQAVRNDKAAEAGGDRAPTLPYFAWRRKPLDASA